MTATAPQPDTLAAAAAAAAADQALAFKVQHLCTLIRLQRDPEGLTGAHAAALAPKLGAPEHLVLVAIAQLTGRDVAEVASEATPPPAPAEAPKTLSQQRQERRRVLAALQEREPFKPTGEADLDRLVASQGKFAARAAARIIEPRLGRRDPLTLRAWERTDLVAAVGSEEFAEAGLQLLAAIRERPHIRAAWERWQRSLAPNKGRHASAPAGPPDRRYRVLGEREMGELGRRLRKAREIPLPWAYGRWPVIRDRHAQRDPDTGLYTVKDMKGTVSSSFKPTVRYQRNVGGLALVLREADHVPNPGDEEHRRTVRVSYNMLELAASGREGCQGSQYDAWDRFLLDMETGYLAGDLNEPEKFKVDLSLQGTPIEAVHVLLEGGQVLPLSQWLKLPKSRRPRRRRGPGPTLMLTFTEAFYAAVMKREGHFLVSKETAWALRDELVMYVRIEANTGIRRDPNVWELFAGAPFLQEMGYSAADRRAAELLVEDDLHAIEEVWAPVTAASVGDGKNGHAWLSVVLNRRGECGRRETFKGRRTRTRQERREAWETERPGRVGRRRSFAKAGSPGRATLRAQARAQKVVGLAAAAKPTSRRRHNARQRARVQGDLSAAARAREAA